MSELFDAIGAGDAGAVTTALVRDPGAVDERDAEGVSALRRCLYRGRRDLAELVLAATPTLDLFDAAAVGDTTAVARLLAEHSDIDDRSSDGFTALHLAAFFDAPHAAVLLLRAGADPEAVATNSSAVQPLHSAVAGRSTAVSCALLVAGAAVDAAQHGGFTALMAAAQHGDGPLLDLLLALGADPARATDDGRTASDLARSAGHGQIAERLSRAG